MHHEGILMYECRCGKRFNKCSGKNSLMNHHYEEWKKGDPDSCLKYQYAKTPRQRYFKRRLAKELEEEKMAGRYVITGVQLGILLGHKDTEKSKELLEKIQKEQFIGNSDESVENDVELLQNLSIWAHK